MLVYCISWLIFIALTICALGEAGKMVWESVCFTSKWFSCLCH